MSERGQEASGSSNSGQLGMRLCQQGRKADPRKANGQKAEGMGCPLGGRGEPWGGIQPFLPLAGHGIQGRTEGSGVVIGAHAEWGQPGALW